MVVHVDEPNFPEVRQELRVDDLRAQLPDEYPVIVDVSAPHPSQCARLRLAEEWVLGDGYDLLVDRPPQDTILLGESDVRLLEVVGAVDTPRETRPPLSRLGRARPSSLR